MVWYVSDVRSASIGCCDVRCEAQVTDGRRQNATGHGLTRWQWHAQITELWYVLCTAMDAIRIAALT